MTRIDFSRRSILAASGAALAACAHAPGAADETLVWEHKMISSGGNFPDFRSGAPINTDILVALHQLRAPPRSPEADAALALLEEKRFVTRRDGVVRPSVFVAGPADARWLAVSNALVRDSVALIAAALPAVRARVQGIGNLGAIPFEHSSFFILSDVLLDNWQINAVEEGVLGVERPERGGGRYYYAVMARSADSDEEPFGIYGNQTYGYDGFVVGVYGNKRVTAPSLPALSDADLAARFGAGAESGALARRLAEAARGASALSAAEIAGFRSLDLVDEVGRVLAPVLSEAESEALDGVAALVRAPLIARLNAEKDALRRLHGRSPYAEETTFEEYFMWWYHVYYTRVTDALIAAGEATAPRAGVVTYVVI